MSRPANRPDLTKVLHEAQEAIAEALAYAEYNDHDHGRGQIRRGGRCPGGECDCNVSRARRVLAAMHEVGILGGPTGVETWLRGWEDRWQGLLPPYAIGGDAVDGWEAADAAIARGEPRSEGLATWTWTRGGR